MLRAHGQPRSPARSPLLLAAPGLQLGAELGHEAGIAPEDPAPLKLLPEDLGWCRGAGRGPAAGQGAGGREEPLQVAEEPSHLEVGAGQAAKDFGAGGVEVALVPGDVLQCLGHAGHGPPQPPQPRGPRRWSPQPCGRVVGAAEVVDGQALVFLLSGDGEERSGRGNGSSTGTPPSPSSPTSPRDPSPQGRGLT